MNDVVIRPKLDVEQSKNPKSFGGDHVLLMPQTMVRYLGKLTLEQTKNIGKKHRAGHPDLKPGRAP